MVACQQCGRDMLGAVSCASRMVTIAGVDHMRIPFGKETGADRDQQSDRCHDCNAAPGGFHHHGCDVEECPACRGQLISCACSVQGLKGARRKVTK